MTPAALPFARFRAKVPVHQAVLVGGLCLGTLDALFAIAFWVPKGASVGGVFRSISAGLLGKAAQGGGLPVALLGAGLHYLIATSMVLAFTLASRRWAWLLARPVACGVVYGVLLYFFMNFVVLPLSAAGMQKFDNVAWVALSILMHAVFGVIAAFAAGLAAPTSAAPRDPAGS
jgi:hypothetical protein